MAKSKSDNPNWKGGRSITPHGYVLVKVYDNNFTKNSTGYAYEHRHIMEKHLGRKLIKGEMVHHINHNKLDNRIENLMLCKSAAHHKYNHRKRTYLRKPGELNPTVTCACGCGNSFLKYDQAGRPRKYFKHHSHAKGKHKFDINETVFCACGCGIKIKKYDNFGRVRKFISGHNKRGCNGNFI